MQFRALATDYDGTLATHGYVDEPTIDALRRFASSGNPLIMVTGRQVEDLGKVFPYLDLFVRVVAENGAVVFDPATSSNSLLCDPPSQELVRLLRDRGIPFSMGQAIIATEEPYQRAIREVIRDSGIAVHAILNKDSLMVLPADIDKTTGLQRALSELCISPDTVVGVGDAENDIEFLSACGCGVAVANALPSVKSRADFVTHNGHGAGVAEVISHLLRDGQLPCNRHSRVRQFLVPD